MSVGKLDEDFSGLVDSPETGEIQPIVKAGQGCSFCGKCSVQCIKGDALPLEKAIIDFLQNEKKSDNKV